ncbi:MAG: inositol monophosphatase [Deltaproteobacteria bacterium SG8_13]|nr:MAG: inositol monophosphatase [Deltaproteobacteria bacterium SG8_13]
MSSAHHRGIEELENFAMDVIHQVGEKALAFYGKGEPRIKFDEELVTEAELQLSGFFERQLQDRFPDHHLFKDTFESTQYTHEGDRYLWVFDPLDGVANFQAGIPIWAVTLSLIENFWPVLGVVFMPATGDLFHAQAGKQAYWGNQSIQISNIDTINDESLLLTYSRFHQHYRPVFPGKIRALGCTSAHICYVAMGRADAAIVSHESFQDLAAARVILESAGGKLGRMDGSEFFLEDYFNGERIEGHLLAAVPENLPLVRECLNPNS